MSTFGGFPNEIQIPGSESAPAEEEPGIDELERQAIDTIQKLVDREPDDSKSAVLAKILADLYKAVSDEQDTQMKMMGGDPKQMRQMAKASGGDGGY